MNSLGIYFGPKAICIIETKGKKIVSNIQISQSTISTADLEERASVESRAGGITTLIKEELVRNKIQAKEATLCLSGKDLIIRTFEMPMMPREELQSAINFEVKKYIPFKVEDLISDSQIEVDKLSRINLVLFVGIKKETLTKYISILNQLNLKVKAIEYSAFSILRCLKLTGSNQKGVIGLFAADMSGEDEATFTVLENGFPLFSRDIVLTGEPGSMSKPEKTGPEILALLERLKTEIRVSLDYYNRKFPSKNIKKVFLLCNQEFSADLEALIKELGLSVKFTDVIRYIQRSIPYSLSFIKGYCTSLCGAIKIGIKVNLLEAKERAAVVTGRTLQSETLSLLKGIRLNLGIISLGIAICLAVFGYGIYRKIPLANELKVITKKRPNIAGISPDASYEELTSIDSRQTEKLNNLNNIIYKQLYLTSSLKTIVKAMPRGLWLSNFSFIKQDEQKAELILEGMVYLVKKETEFDAVNKFVSNLKQGPNFSAYFKNISVKSLDRTQFEGIPVSKFEISCRTY